MKIGIFQSNIEWENKEDNIRKLENQLKKLEGDIQVLFLPEMSLTGFTMNTIACGEDDYYTKERISTIAEKYGTAIGCGWINKKYNSENHYTVIGQRGNVLSDYVKIHPFSYANEDKYYVAGSKLSFFELGGFVFSTLICYDLRFPELFSIAASRANVIVVPACWPAKRREHWMCLLRARAIENQVYIIGVNCVGNIGEKNYNGDSCIINPNGEVLIHCSGEERILQVDISNDVTAFRKEFPTFYDRKNSLYCELLNGANNYENK